MKTTIKSLIDAIDAISFKTTDYNIVSIRNSKFPDVMYEDFDISKENYKDIIVSTFDDIIVPHEGYVLASMLQVTRILKWAKERDNILVHCHAGICRSSAIAYLIECIDNPPEEAIKTLSEGNHYPNEWVVMLGSLILNKPAIYDTMETFNKNEEQIISKILATKDPSLY